LGRIDCYPGPGHLIARHFLHQAPRAPASKSFASFADQRCTRILDQQKVRSIANLLLCTRYQEHWLNTTFLRSLPSAQHSSILHHLALTVEPHPIQYLNTRAYFYIGNTGIIHKRSTPNEFDMASLVNKISRLKIISYDQMIRSFR